MLERVTVFSPSGDVIRSFRLARTSLRPEFNAPMGFDSSHRFVDRATLSSTPEVDSIGVVTYAPDGEVLETAFLVAIQRDPVMLERGGSPFMTIPRPFMPRTSFAFGREGRVYLSRGDEYRGDVFSADGEHLRTIARPFEPTESRPRSGTR